MTILVVDDEPAIRGLLIEVLRDEGYDAVGAENGAAALASAAWLRPALILLDMRMPVMNGWEFAAAYRATPGPHAPILVLTAAASAQKWAEEIGAAGYAAKPFDIVKLLGEINRLTDSTATLCPSGGLERARGSGPLA